MVSFVQQISNSNKLCSLDGYNILRLLSLIINIKLLKMQRENLPAYKQTFLAEMDELRRQQQQQEARRFADQAQQSQVPQNPVVVENNILNTSQYSSPDWRQTLNQTTTGNYHNETHFDLNKLMNPEVAKKQHNIRSTQISQYSNARHNNTVFVNPKNTSC